MEDKDVNSEKTYYEDYKRSLRDHAFGDEGAISESDKESDVGAKRKRSESDMENPPDDLIGTIITVRWSTGSGRNKGGLAKITAVVRDKEEKLLTVEVKYIVEGGREKNIPIGDFEWGNREGLYGDKNFYRPSKMKKGKVGNQDSPSHGKSDTSSAAKAKKSNIAETPVPVRLENSDIIFEDSWSKDLSLERNLVNEYAGRIEAASIKNTIERRVAVKTFKKKLINGFVDVVTSQGVRTAKVTGFKSKTSTTCTSAKHMFQLEFLHEIGPKWKELKTARLVARKYALSKYKKWFESFLPEGGAPVEMSDLSETLNQIVMDLALQNPKHKLFWRPVLKGSFWKGKYEGRDKEYRIEFPMDLGSIKVKVDTGKYDNADDFINDVKLIANNCRTYNQEDAGLVEIANGFEREFASLIVHYGLKKEADNVSVSLHDTDNLVQNESNEKDFDELVGSDQWERSTDALSETLAPSRRDSPDNVPGGCYFRTISPMKVPCVVSNFLRGIGLQKFTGTIVGEWGVGTLDQMKYLKTEDFQRLGMRLVSSRILEKELRERGVAVQWEWKWPQKKLIV